jgi:hypothetical protein
MLGIVYYPGVGKMPTSSDTAIKLATSAGTVVGQFGFGTLADIVRPTDTVSCHFSWLVLTSFVLGRPQENVWSGAYDHHLCDGCPSPYQWLSIHGCVCLLIPSEIMTASTCYLHFRAASGLSSSGECSWALALVVTTHCLLSSRKCLPCTVPPSCGEIHVIHGLFTTCIVAVHRAASFETDLGQAMVESHSML